MQGKLIRNGWSNLGPNLQFSKNYLFMQAELDEIV